MNGKCHPLFFFVLEALNHLWTLSKNNIIIRQWYRTLLESQRRFTRKKKNNNGKRTQQGETNKIHHPSRGIPVSRELFASRGLKICTDVTPPTLWPSQQVKNIFSELRQPQRSDLGGRATCAKLWGCSQGEAVVDGGSICLSGTLRRIVGGTDGRGGSWYQWGWWRQWGLSSTPKGNGN